MTGLTIGERLRVGFLAADRSRRRTIARILGSPLLRWRFGAPVADHLLIVPPDLRTADPSFLREIELGQFGLAGTIAVLGDASPFEIMPPNDAWQRALHGFGWLRHLEAAGSDQARDTARRLAVEWTIRHGHAHGIAGEPAVIARRIISWLSHAGLLLEGADTRSYAAIASSLGADLVRLSSAWRDAPDGHPRLLCLIALTLAGISIAGHERQLGETERALSAELSRQILPDGGHVSRNSGVLIELLLDLLPLRQCFASRGRPAPAVLGPTMQRMLAMLRAMRMGDGMLARFNGVSVAVPAGLATVLGYDDSQEAPSGNARRSGYVRLERGSTVLIMDAGPPPPLELAGSAHAGCLSFEFSSGTHLILVNGGAPGSADAEWRAAARSTASHNTLCLAESSSSRLVRNAALDALVGSPPIRGPANVRARLEEHGGNLELSAEHDGYVDRFGLLHKRTLVLAGTGRRLLGIDMLMPPRGRVRLRQDLPFTIHFHLHPDVACRLDGQAGLATITLARGEVWSFSLEGASLALEESTYFADSSGPRRSLQLVARAATFGETEVRWVLESRS